MRNPFFGTANVEPGYSRVHSSAAARHGTATVVTSGTDTGKIVYTPNAEWSGTDSFTYTLSDGMGDTSTATVTVAGAKVNDAEFTTSAL